MFENLRINIQYNNIVFPGNIPGIAIFKNLFYLTRLTHIATRCLLSSLNQDIPPES